MLDTNYAVRKLGELREKIKDWEAGQARAKDSRAWKAEVEDWLGTSGGATLGTELDRKRDEFTRGGANLYGDVGA